MNTLRPSEVLALEGGTPAAPGPWPPRRLFGEAEKQAVVALFDRAVATGEAITYEGDEEKAYAREFAEWLGGGFADGVNSGTNALYVALIALGLNPFGEVIVPAITDPGGVMPVALAGQIPVPADTAPGSFNGGADQIAACLSPRTRAIMVAHIAGLPCDMGPIVDLARRHGIPLIEDCAQAHGARYRGRPVGTFGQVAVFSMMYGKHHACGGQGGMVFTRDEGLYWRIRQAADRGKPFGPASASLGPGAAENVMAALNCNMDEIHAAIGRVQLRKLPEILRRRREIACALAEGCRQRLQTVRVLEPSPHDEGAYWFVLLRLDLDRVRVDKTRMVEALKAEGLPVGASYLSVPAFQPWYRDRVLFGWPGHPWLVERLGGSGGPDPELPNAREVDARHFRLMIHEGWGRREVEWTLRALEKVERAYAQ